jgi:MYXO-CTERM domain-containing protein
MKSNVVSLAAAASGAACAVLLVVGGPAASAATFTLTAVTNTTPNFAGTIFINGTVTMGAGETFLNPNIASTTWYPFLSNFSAGFNGTGNAFDPGFLAWNGVGTYSGPIFNDAVAPSNLGYSGGMPQGLYGFNPLGPGGQSAIELHYIDTAGAEQTMTAAWAVNVTPTPGAAAALALGGAALARRRRA